MLKINDLQFNPLAPRIVSPIIISFGENTKKYIIRLEKKNKKKYQQISFRDIGCCHHMATLGAHDK